MCVCGININMQHKMIQIKLCSLVLSTIKCANYTTYTSTEFDADRKLLFVRQEKVYSRRHERTCHRFVSSSSANRRCTVLAADSHTTISSCSRVFTSVATLRRAEDTPAVPPLPGRHRWCTPQHTGEYPKGRYRCEPVESTWWRGWQV